MWAARLVPSHGRRFAPPSQSRLAAEQRQAAEAEGTMHALGLPRPRRPAVGHGLGTVKGTLAPPRCERGLEGSQERGQVVGLLRPSSGGAGLPRPPLVQGGLPHPPGPRGPQHGEEGAVVAEDAVVALRDVDEGRADDFEDALFGNAGAGLGDFAFVIQGSAVAKQQRKRKLQEAEVQEQCCVQEASGSSGDGGWGDIGEQPARKARRKRSDGPPQVNRSTGSLCKALDIAADLVARRFKGHAGAALGHACGQDGRRRPATHPGQGHVFWGCAPRGRV